MYIDDKPMVEFADKLQVHRNTLTNWLKQNEIKTYINNLRQKHAVTLFLFGIGAVLL